MKKLLLFAIVFVLFQALNAHTLKSIKSPKNASLKEFNSFIDQATSQKGIVSNAYKILKVEPVKPGEKIASKIKRVMEYSFHKDYPITGDEDGYSLALYDQPSYNELMNGINEWN